MNTHLRDGEHDKSMATPGAQSSEVLATQNDVAVRITARNQSDRVDADVGQRQPFASGDVEISPGARS